MLSTTAPLNIKSSERRNADGTPQLLKQGACSRPPLTKGTPLKFKPRRLINSSEDTRGAAVLPVPSAPVVETVPHATRGTGSTKPIFLAPKSRDSIGSLGVILPGVSKMLSSAYAKAPELVFKEPQIQRRSDRRVDPDYSPSKKHQRRRSGEGVLHYAAVPEEPKVEHPLLIYRMGTLTYIQRCFSGGLVLDFRNRDPDPLRYDTRALDVRTAPWWFSHEISASTTAESIVPLPGFAPGERALVAWKPGGLPIKASEYIVIEGCRAYYVPVPGVRNTEAHGYVCQYAVPMYVLDLMERGSAGYNAFRHRIESPCGSMFSCLAVQMSSGSLTMRSETSSSAVEVQQDDYTGISIGASHFSDATISCVPFMSPYVYSEGALCKECVFLTSLGVSDYRPEASVNNGGFHPPMVSRLKVLCVSES